MVITCPGPGDEEKGFCDRITGVGDGSWTELEMWEEASPGCPRRCQKLKSCSRDSGEISEMEAHYICQRIEGFVNRSWIEPLNPENFKLWEWDLIVYWRKVERDFERNIWVDLGILAKGFLKGN